MENIETIEKRLWSSADTLRANSNYASNEYFLPVMGLIFLRHAYSRYLKVLDDIKDKLPKRGGKTRPLTKEDFSEKNAIYLRPEAQFDYLVSLPDSDDRARANIPKPTTHKLFNQLLKVGILDTIRPAAGRRPAILTFAELLNTIEQKQLI